MLHSFQQFLVLHIIGYDCGHRTQLWICIGNESVPIHQCADGYVFRNEHSKILVFMYCFSSVFAIEYFNCGLCFPVCITLHLSTLNCICQSFDHFCSDIKSLCRISQSWTPEIPWNILVLSANFRTQFSRPLSRSFINMRKSTGPNTCHLLVRPLMSQV